MKGKRPLWKRLAIIAAVLAIILVIAGFFSRGWIEAKAGTLIQAELEKRQIHSTYDVESFSFVRGLKLQNVVLHHTAEHNDAAFSLSNLALNFKLRQLLRGETSTVRITTNDADFTVHHPEKPLEIRDLNLNLEASSDRVVLDACRALVVGINLEVSGDLSLAKGKSTAPPSAEAVVKKPLTERDLTPIGRVLYTLAMESEGTPPRLRLEVNRKTDGQIDAKGNLTGKAFSWRGFAFDSADVVFETAPDPAGGSRPGNVHFPSINLTHTGRQLAAAATYDLGARTVAIEHLDSSVDPFVLARTINGKSGEERSRVSFPEPPEWKLAGTVHISDPEKTALTGSFAAPSLHVATPKGSGLTFSGVATSITLAEGVLKLPDLNAAALGGKVTAPSEIHVFAKPLHFNTDLKLEGASPKQLVEAIGANEKLGGPGSLLLTFKGGGEPSLAGLDGGGQIRVADTDVVSVPVLNQLTPVFGQLITGFQGGEAGTNVSCTYQLNGGVFTSNDISLKESALDVSATTRANIPERQLYATAAVRTKGLSKLVTIFTGKALELEATGTFDNYTWQFKNLPGIKNLSDFGKLGTGVTGDALGGAGETAAGALETGVEGVGEGVKKTLGGLEKLIPGKE